MVDEDGQTSNRNHQELHSECVMVAVVRCLELVIDEEESEEGESEEDNFHGGVVERDKGCQQVQVPSCVDHGKHDLRLS